MGRKNKRLFLAVFFAMLLQLPCSAKGKPVISPAKAAVDSLWHKPTLVGTDTLQAYIDFYHTMLEYVAAHCADDTTAVMENHVQAMRHLRNYYFSHPNMAVRKNDLQDILNHIDINSDAFLDDFSASLHIDTYFQCRQIMDGADLHEVFDDDTYRYHYETYRSVLEQGSAKMMLAYCPMLITEFRYEGLTPALKRIKPLLMERFPEGEKKEELRRWYGIYERLEPGQPAPEFTLEGDDGQVHRLSDFRGRKVVIDAWATWCHVCIAKLPKFMEIVQKYKKRDDVVFLTISIDENRDTWLRGLKRLNVKGQLNLHAPAASHFIDNYHAAGVPLYIIIDENGKFISSKAPYIGYGFEEFLDKTLNSK